MPEKAGVVQFMPQMQYYHEMSQADKLQQRDLLKQGQKEAKQFIKRIHEEKKEREKRMKEKEEKVKQRF